MDINLLLVICGIVMILCVICNRITNKIGIPLLLAFIFLGMLFGSDGIFAIQFDNFKIAEHICATALIFIMFYGGFGAKWAAIRPVMKKSLLLSSLGTILTAFATAFFCHFVLGINFAESMLIGSVLSPTDAACVFSILKTKKLSLKNGADATLEVESGSNDPFAYMLTIITISVIKSGSLDIKGILLSVVLQIALGVLFGVVIAFVTAKLLKKMKFDIDGFDTIFIIAAIILSYALPMLVNGNGYLSVYIVGIILGNTDMHNKKAMVHFFDGITGLMQILIFFLLGLLSFPSKMLQVIPFALAIAGFLTFVARPISVALILKWFKVSLSQIVLISWAGLRGASSIVFVIIACLGVSSTENDIFHIVFFVVLLSIGIQGSLLPLVSKKLNMLLSDGNVLKNFNDYTDDVDLDFIRLKIDKNNSWIHREVKNLELPPGCLLILIKRNKENIIPCGDTIIEENDVVILSASSYNDNDDINLKEISIDSQHEWNNKKISQLSLSDNSLIIMIKRNSNTIVPNGNTLIKENDIIVIGYV